MARSNELSVVDGVEYRVGQLSPTDSIRLLVRILKLAGASVGTVLDSVVPGMGTAQSEEGEEVPANMPDLMQNLPLERVLALLADRLEEESAIKLIKDSLKQTFVASDLKAPLSTTFDVYFAEKGILHLFKLVKEVWAVQFPDFFGENGMFGGSRGRLRAMSQKGTQ